MTLFLDTSAVLAAVVDGRDRPIIVGVIADHPDDTFASALGLTEALAAIDRLVDSEILRADLEDAVRRLWDHLHIVPVDQRCLDDAARLARERPIRLSDAIHLAAALRLPAPVMFATVDPAHISTAIGLGCEVVAP
jgi:predicted nucleic acid-binding protein